MRSLKILRWVRGGLSYFLYKGREAKWNSVWRETVASHRRNRTDHSVFYDTRCSPLLPAKPCFISSAFLWAQIETKIKACRGYPGLWTVSLDFYPHVSISIDRKMNRVNQIEKRPSYRSDSRVTTVARDKSSYWTKNYSITLFLQTWKFSIE